MLVGRRVRRGSAIFALGCALTFAARSPLPKVFPSQPKRIWAETLSPSVTETWRMLSPMRASLRLREQCQPRAARAHAASMANWMISAEDLRTGLNAVHDGACSKGGRLNENSVNFRLGGVKRLA